MSVTASPSASPSAAPGPSYTPWMPSGSEATAAQQFNTMAANPTGLGSGQVFMGLGQPTTIPAGGMGQSHELGATRTVQNPVWASIQTAQADFGNWTQKQINDFVAQGIMAGQLKPGDGTLEAGKLWDSLVTSAARFGAQGNQVSPFDILKSYITNQQAAGNWIKTSDGLFEVNQLTGAKRYVGPQFRTTTQTSVNLTDPTTAKAVATSIFQQMLGRDPLPGEMNSYASALQQAEQANPTVLESTNQYDSQGNIIATTKQSQRGGFDANAQQFLAAQQVKAKPEYGATQAATTYENAFENAVFGATR